MIASVLFLLRSTGRTTASQDLAEEITAQFDQATAQLKGITAQKKVLFILSTQGGRILASGTDTAAHGIIEMAGGINAVTSFSGYKPLTDEAIAVAAPDVILMMDRSGDHNIDNDALFSMPALVPTPAA